MKAAPPSPKDRAREQAVKALRLLDTAPEERFDRITRLAQRMFAVNAASISLLDATREWHKSSVGLSQKEIPIDLSFVAHALQVDDVTVVDTQLDQRFADHPHRVGEQPVRFFAACPITVRNGVKVGALTLAASHARAFDDDDRALLRDLARLAEQELDGKKLGNMDELTHLSNRSGFEDLAQHALNICRASQNCVPDIRPSGQ